MDRVHARRTGDLFGAQRTPEIGANEIGGVGDAAPRRREAIRRRLAARFVEQGEAELFGGERDRGIVLAKCPEEG